MILGRAWQQRYNCSINWANQTVSYMINEVQTCVKLSQPMTRGLIHNEDVPPSTANSTLKKDAPIEEGSPSSLAAFTLSQFNPSAKDHKQASTTSSSTITGAARTKASRRMKNMQVLRNNQPLWILKLLLTNVDANGRA